ARIRRDLLDRGQRYLGDPAQAVIELPHLLADDGEVLLLEQIVDRGDASRAGVLNWNEGEIRFAGEQLRHRLLVGRAPSKSAAQAKAGKVLLCRQMAVRVGRALVRNANLAVGGRRRGEKRRLPGQRMGDDLREETAGQHRRDAAFACGRFDALEHVAFSLRVADGRRAASLLTRDLIHQIQTASNRPDDFLIDLIQARAQRADAVQIQIIRLFHSAHLNLSARIRRTFPGSAVPCVSRSAAPINTPRSFFSPARKRATSAECEASTRSIAAEMARSSSSFSRRSSRASDSGSPPCSKRCARSVLPAAWVIRPSSASATKRPKSPPEKGRASGLLPLAKPTRWFSSHLAIESGRGWTARAASKNDDTAWDLVSKSACSAGSPSSFT